MTLAHARPAALRGHPHPRIAPPMPARSLLRDVLALAKRLEIDLYPWQEIAARYITALGPGDRWLYPEDATIVSRQEGKTLLLRLIITLGLLRGERIMHTAQNRELPREVHDAVAETLTEHFRDKLPARRGIRYGAGQEEIRLLNGGRYRIVAPTRSGARGPSNDRLIIDELREMEGHEFIGAAEPTLSAALNPKIDYFSNAGTEKSDVLNKLRKRATIDPALAYLEWSAAPERAVDDIEGWLEANPSIGHSKGKLDYLRRKLNSYGLAGQLAIFETEHLCRWVNTMREPLVDLGRWKAAEGPVDADVRRPFMAVSIDPVGRRASAAIAWPLPDGRIATRLPFDVTGNPIDPDRLGKDLQDDARKRAVQMVGFDPLTDALLAKHFPNTEPISGAKFANGTARFVELVEGGRLVWADSGAVTEDLAWAARKPHDESGSFQAVRAQDDRPITAVLAMIRAVWLASAPGLVSVYSDRGLVSV